MHLSIQYPNSKFPFSMKSSVKLSQAVPSKTGSSQGLLPWAKMRKNNCDLPDEVRCRRSDRNKGWRCRNPRAPSNIYCHHHIDVYHRKSLRLRKLRSGQTLHNHAENGTAHFVTEIGLTGRCLYNNTRRIISRPHIAQAFSMPNEIFQLDDLSGILTMDAWHECLNETERSQLRSFLPEGYKCDSDVKCLLNGEFVRFGMDPARGWGQSVCRGYQNPSLLIGREKGTKMHQLEYYKMLREYCSNLISKIEELERLCFQVCQGDDAMFRKQLVLLRERGLKLNKKVCSAEQKGFPDSILLAISEKDIRGADPQRSTVGDQSCFN